MRKSKNNTENVSSKEIVAVLRDVLIAGTMATIIITYLVNR